MPNPGSAPFYLNLPAFPDWWRDGLEHNLGEQTVDRCTAKITKTADGNLYVFVYVVEFGEAVAEVRLVTPPRHLPIHLVVLWDNDGVRLSQNGQGSKPFPWLEPRRVR
jgi:hypothetical protein